MKFLRYLLPATLSLLIATNVSSQDFNLDLKGKAKGKISSFKDAKINAYTQQFTDSINSFIKNNLNKDMTTILIAHRLNTVKNCDTIFQLENGKLIRQGTPDKLLNRA